ncbi:hypothetical protein C3Y89_32125 [Rhizobium sp. UPM1132]|uniref:hypothetical protein n=1 Tax=Rhizobium ruizarguesonis TaxID=2081791 RepID=UPI00144675C9|nr:hypothetical protein [Rhizobium ruizarguesonis]NKQ74925.1 hypothetical protein [Rhizobium ruizarguesonis]
MRLERSVVRGLKNVKSKRGFPIHPELMRLGFLKYVVALKETWPSPALPRVEASGSYHADGDVFDESCQEMRASTLPEAKGEGKVLHSFRHWCNKELKQAGGHAEIKKDILGHTNEDVIDDRYSDAMRLRVMAEALAPIFGGAYLKQWMARDVKFCE